MKELFIAATVGGMVTGALAWAAAQEGEPKLAFELKQIHIGLGLLVGAITFTARGGFA